MNIFDSWLINTPIAHRGIHNNDTVVENSLSAFDESAKKNYPIELDVRITTDDEIIVFHDDCLSRLTSADGYIDNCSYAQIEHLRLLKTEDKIPTLKQVFEVVNGRVPILIEIKNSKKVGHFERILLNLIKSYNGKVAVESFNPYVLEWFSKTAPEILRGQLSSYFRGNLKMSFSQRFNYKRLRFNKISKPDFICYDSRYLPNRFVNKYCELPLLTYTIKNQKDYLHIMKYADNVIFEGFNPTI